MFLFGPPRTEDFFGSCEAVSYRLLHDEYIYSLGLGRDYEVIGCRLMKATQQIFVKWGLLSFDGL
jgi:hypothetical protein